MSGFRDWKTGRETTEDTTQLAVYALYAMDRWGIAPEDLRLTDVYLRQGRSSDLAVACEQVESTRCLIADSIAQMQAHLYDVAANRACIEDFPSICHNGACRRCAFKEACRL